MSVRSSSLFAGALALLATFVAPVQPASATSPYLVIPPKAEAEASPSFRYAHMTEAQALAELDRRQVPYRRLKRVAGVRTPVKMTGPLHGVSIHGALPADQRAASLFEVVDARFLLALDDFAQLLEKHDIVEVVHFTMYRPNGPKPGSEEEKLFLEKLRQQAEKARGDVPKAPERRAGKRSAGKRAASKGSAPKGAASKGAASKGAASKGAASKGSAPKGAASKGSASKGSASKGSAGKVSAGKVSASEGAVSKGAASKGAASKGSASKGSASKGSAGKVSASKVSASKGAVSKGAASKGAASKSSAKPPRKGTRSKGAKPAAAKPTGAKHSALLFPLSGHKAKSEQQPAGAKAPLKAATRRGPAKRPQGKQPPPVRKKLWAPPGTRHPAGLAIDVGFLVKRDGRRLGVAHHFQGHIGAQTCGANVVAPASAEARELRSIVCEARDLGLFTYVLTPNFDRAHADHFHMEIRAGVHWYLYH